MKLRPRITTTIKREFLAEIVSGEKLWEYRDAKSYWRRRLAHVARPFELRMINGMRRRAPEVTVLIDKVTESKKHHEFRLRIAKVLSVKNWDRTRQRPK